MNGHVRIWATSKKTQKKSKYLSQQRQPTSGRKETRIEGRNKIYSYIINYEGMGNIFVFVGSGDSDAEYVSGVCGGEKFTETSET